ncbi:MAG TPA: hypothetical protein VFO85_11970 [Vicinamibacteria bacterium]|nr:hypothetical protein [Vicinamibacteria bacterium]
MIDVAGMVVLLLAQAPDQTALEEMRRSRIEANVPPPQEMAPLLRRDLEAYFKALLSKPVRVEHQFLREGPTQSGVEYPRFYLWVSVSAAGAVITEGAVGVLAIERRRFEVTAFVSDKKIRANPSSIYRVFPPSVCERIRVKLGLPLPWAPVW